MVRPTEKIERLVVGQRAFENKHRSPKNGAMLDRFSDEMKRRSSVPQSHTSKWQPLRPSGVTSGPDGITPSDDVDKSGDRFGGGFALRLPTAAGPARFPGTLPLHSTSVDGGHDRPSRDV